MSTDHPDPEPFDDRPGGRWSRLPISGEHIFASFTVTAVHDNGETAVVVVEINEGAHPAHSGANVGYCLRRTDDGAWTLLHSHGLDPLGEESATEPIDVTNAAAAHTILRIVDIEHWAAIERIALGDEPES